MKKKKRKHEEKLKGKRKEGKKGRMERKSEREKRKILEENIGGK